MRSFFNPDSGFSRFMGRVADLMILNILFVLTCIPVVTAGAAAAAMYTVCFRMGTDREAGVVKPFFAAFRENFKKSTILWLILLVLFALTGFNFFFFLRLTGPMHNLWIFSLIVLVFLAAVLSYAIPLQSQFENTVGQTLKNALLLSVAYLPRTLLMLVIHLAPTALYLVNPYYFIRTSCLLFILYYAVGAFCCTRLLRKAFAPLMEQSEIPA